MAYLFSKVFKQRQRYTNTDITFAIRCEFSPNGSMLAVCGSLARDASHENKGEIIVLDVENDLEICARFLFDDVKNIYSLSRSCVN